MTFFSVPWFIASTFSRRGVSTKGTSTIYPINHFGPPLHDELVGGFPVARLVALGWGGPTAKPDASPSLSPSPPPSGWSTGFFGHAADARRDAVRASGFVPLRPSTRSRVRCCPPGGSWRSTPCRSCGSCPTASSPMRTTPWRRAGSGASGALRAILLTAFALTSASSVPSGILQRQRIARQQRRPPPAGHVRVADLEADRMQDIAVLPVGSARRQRFGSYSMVLTFAGMSRLSRLKSIPRPYMRLWPPPRHHDVKVLRPPVE